MNSVSKIVCEVASTVVIGAAAGTVAANAKSKDYHSSPYGHAGDAYLTVAMASAGALATSIGYQLVKPVAAATRGHGSGGGAQNLARHLPGAAGRAALVGLAVGAGLKLLTGDTFKNDIYKP